MKYTCILVVLILLLTPAYAEEVEKAQYVLEGSLGPAVQTQTGPYACIANGVSVYPLTPLSELDNAQVIVPVHLLGMDGTTATTLYVLRADIIDVNRYSGIFDFPDAYIQRRTPFYKSISENNRGIHGVLVCNDKVTIYAHIESYYYISHQGVWGYIPDDAINGFITTNAYRNYTSYLEYSEVAFVEGTPSGNEPISSETAIVLSRTYLMANCGETAEHLDSMTTEVSYNISHMYGTMGTTWYVEFWGCIDTLSSSAFEEYPPSSHEALHLYYTLEVNTNTGEVYLIAIGNLG